MNKKRIDVTIPQELYDKYRDELSFSGLLTELLENMDFITSSEQMDETVIINTHNNNRYYISIKDMRKYIDYIKQVNKK